MKHVLFSSMILVSAQWATSSVTASAEASVSSGFDVRRAEQEAFRAVAEAMRPYLVRIQTVGGSQPTATTPEPSTDDDAEEPPRLQNPFRDTLGSNFTIADGPATGIVYSSDGYIVTSSFNFVREPLLISVALYDGRRLAADLVARDQVRKIALLKIDAKDLPVPQWRPRSDLRVGEWAIALGLGFGGDNPSVTVGIISALYRMQRNAIQTGAKLSPANYGGPLCDVHGRVIGINVPMAQRPGELAGVEMYDCGVGFALPKERVDEIVSVLREGRSFYRGWLGMVTDSSGSGSLIIKNIADPSPLREVGIKPGDRLLGAAPAGPDMEIKPIKHYGHLLQALYMVPAGEPVYLHLERDGIEFGATVTLARSSDLGPLPPAPEPFDPSHPIVFPERDEEEE